MFFRRIRRSAAKNRKNNSLFFGSLAAAIVAFYTLLSLESQDVIRFLKTLESDAIERLLLLIPVVYAVSLFFVFFLVYFAYRYQMDGRRKEFGLYLMLGMGRGRLFAMLMGETLWNSLVSVLAGLPIALLLTEGISLATAKVIGLGIVGHKISLSLPAVLWTVAGFILVQCIAMLALCAQYSRKEPMELMQAVGPERQAAAGEKRRKASLILGLLLLLMAYGAGILLLRGFGLPVIALIFLLGGSGTFLVFQGIGSLIGERIQRKGPSQPGLYTFTGRQIQESVVDQYKALAVASLLLLLALACISFGIGMAAGRGSGETRTADFSVKGTEAEIQEGIRRLDDPSMIAGYYPMYLGHMDIDAHAYSLKGLQEAILKQPDSTQKSSLQDHLGYGLEYVISEASYNQLRASIGKDPIELGTDGIGLYTSMKDDRAFTDLLEHTLKSRPEVSIDGQDYRLLTELYSDNVVADREITLYIAFIVPDEKYLAWTKDGQAPFCWNITVSQEAVDELGLMQAIQKVDERLSFTGLEYESYLSGIGRNLFYTVASSYLSIYLGVLFLLISNTVIGLKYLMQQHACRQRYRTLLMLGAGTKELCKCAGRQIGIFFLLAIGVAAVNSIFAVWSMFGSFMRLPAGTAASKVFLMAGVAFLLFLVFEWIYIHVVISASHREIRTLRATDGRNAL